MDDQGHLCDDTILGMSPGTEDDRDVLAWLVEAEILPRLMLAHRRVPRAAATLPALHDPESLATILLDPEPFDLDSAVAALLGCGLPLDSLLLDILTPAARRLGTMWEVDTCDFLAVTEGLGRLQALTRRLCASMERSANPTGRSVLLMPCPGETHVYGLSILASFFRESGWEVTNLGHSDADPFGLLGAGWYDVLGLSLSCDVCAPTLRTLVPELRRASQNPALTVIVGGPYFARNGAGPGDFGADAYAADAWSAPEIAEAMLDRQALAC